MTTLTFIPLKEEELERSFKQFENGDFLGLKKLTTGFVRAVTPIISENNGKVLSKTKP